MGDRCYLEMQIARRDRAKIEELGLPAEATDFNDNPNTVTLCEEEANYGYFDERSEWTKAGLVFTGSHGRGWDYESAEFCGIDGKEYQVQCDITGAYVVGASVVGGRVVLSQPDIDRLAAYVEAVDRANKYFTTVDASVSP